MGGHTPMAPAPQRGGAAHDIQFGVLGPLQVTVASRPIQVGTPKQRAVLAMLVANANRAVSAADLITAIWEDEPPAAARISVSAYVSNLRRILTEAGIDAHAVVSTAPHGYRLEITPEQSDLARFATEQQAGINAAAAGRFEAASTHLTTALRQWRGAVLDDLRDFAFTEALSNALAEDKIVAQTARAHAEIACGRAHTVVRELETLVGEHPYREPLWAQLITAYYLTDRQSDALDTYHRLKTTLSDDLGIDPAPALRTLYEQILRQEPLDVQRNAQAAAQTIIAFEPAVTTLIDPVTAALRDVHDRLHRLKGAATRIGRSPDNDLVVADDKVSRHHAVINNAGSTHIITDLGSANGVHVNGERIRATAELHDGDTIRVGAQVFVFQTYPPATGPDGDKA
ncbi:MULTISPECIES: BTAD domain-containing putative transcriptional regulator [Mycobacteriaceae]|uniref:FHA domain-containing protein n=1 Tax=Mycolicibacterium mucogenicum DSM 44124 TaxID=1226753 RepID=A0A8H2JE84_MYCMU|nr:MULTISPECIES: BTAD domain-containing putative transcriptional regulator [Mycobacteriaceae]KAB7760295.1 regulator [Mycolicibacterium mucogenicum DSM 44124]QPG67751.1 FHA domain-containing protein [Mycolicibacterium mucogenicum DSM 44124]SEA27807.1 DNA-binding transcriptional activator of the SARP family [Mycobacterium sp. 283mftsu]